MHALMLHASVDFCVHVLGHESWRQHVAAGFAASIHTMCGEGSLWEKEKNKCLQTGSGGRSMYNYIKYRFFRKLLISLLRLFVPRLWYQDGHEHRSTNHCV